MESSGVAPDGDAGTGMPSVSVVIVMRNAAATIGDQLEALTQQQYPGPWDVVVADNGSTDGSAAVARRWEGRLPGLRIVDASLRRGVSYARNTGVAASSGELIAFCDADDVVEPDWLEKLVAGFRDADVVEGAFDTETLNSPETRAWRGRNRRHKMGFLPRAATANCGVRRSVFDALDGWSEEYRSGGDVDFSWRAQLAGYRFGTAPDAVVKYRARPDMKSMALQAFRYGQGHPRLYRNFRGAGMRGKKLRDPVMDLIWLAVRVPLLPFSRARRGNWIRHVAMICGRIVGSIRCRVFYI